jgi:hypothetical protein
MDKKPVEMSASIKEEDGMGRKSIGLTVGPS